MGYSAPRVFSTSAAPLRSTPSNPSATESSPSSVRIPINLSANCYSRPLVLQLNDGENQEAVGRREAMVSSLRIGFGLFGTELLLQPRTSEANAAGATPACELTIAASGLAFCDKVVGTGPEATSGQLIKAHYVGKLEDGKIFDSSYERGRPLTFRLGVGEVIKGWDKGILGGEGVPPMLAGGKRTLRLPPELGYGMRGAGCRGGSCIIPPKSVLIFDVEFIGKA